MSFPESIILPTYDEINEEIWSLHRDPNSGSLSMFDTSRFDWPGIQAEIRHGCSPCPDIITSAFGVSPSILFVSTVYGGIQEGVEKDYNRQTISWHSLVQEVYQRIVVQSRYYRRYGKVYQMASKYLTGDAGFCLTELVKTVLFNKSGGVTGVHSQPSFLRYYWENESHLLKKRLQSIQSQCIIFTMSELATFCTIAALGNEKDLFSINSLPASIEPLLGKDIRNFRFKSQLSRSGNPILQFDSPPNTYTRGIAFSTILKVRGKDIWIVPLPHASGANNGAWRPENYQRLDELFARAYG